MGTWLLSMKMGCSWCNVPGRLVVTTREEPFRFHLLFLSKSQKKKVHALFLYVRRWFLTICKEAKTSVKKEYSFFSPTILTQNPGLTPNLTLVGYCPGLRGLRGPESDSSEVGLGDSEVRIQVKKQHTRKKKACYQNLVIISHFANHCNSPEYLICVLWTFIFL